MSTRFFYSLQEKRNTHQFMRIQHCSPNRTQAFSGGTSLYLVYTEIGTCITSANADFDGYDVGNNGF